MKCPHCNVAYHDNSKFVYVDQDDEGHWAIIQDRCANCKKLVLYLAAAPGVKTNQYHQAFDFNGDPSHVRLVRPRGHARDPVPAEVPPDIAEDYVEACLVLTDSPKASAALSRRCLQSILREAAGVNPGNLVKEIDEVLKGETLPSYLAETIDAVRNIGNFSAHPQKGTTTGKILPVEPHEAEWTLDVLESLFDFYYVQPAKAEAKRQALNEKLAEAGKPEMK